MTSYGRKLILRRRSSWCAAFAEKVRQLGWTPERLAKRFFVSLATANGWLAGMQAPATIERMAAVLCALDVALCQASKEDGYAEAS